MVTLGALLLLAGHGCSSRTAQVKAGAVMPAAATATEPRQPAADSPEPSRHPAILAERYHAHVAFLAHDELKGRGTGSDGIDLAAGYIAGQFAAAGLAPGGPNGTYFQEFTISRDASLSDETALRIDGADLTPVLHEDYRPFGFSGAGDFDAQVVFAGYGITNPDEAHDDYAGLEVDGKCVLMLRREPPGWNPGGGYTDHALFDTKIKLAVEHGAAAVMIVNTDPGDDGIDALMRFRTRRRVHDIPVLHIKRDLAQHLLTAGEAGSLTALQQQLDAGGAGVSRVLEGLRVSGTVAYDIDEIVARNVLGVLPGTGMHAGEHVVIGAHYDHLGERRGKIYNGADDNASGTAGVIELAYTIASEQDRDRSVIFMAFTGEEIGLRGSEHYAANPTVPIDSIVAMLNLDMIGRLDHDDEANMLEVQGLGTGGTFGAIVASCAEAAGIEYLSDPSALGPSDHASFYEAGVPSLFLNTGMHDDYHRPSDDTEKINVGGAVQVVGLAHDIAMAIVNGESVPRYAEVSTPARIFRGTQSVSGVVMGFMPDMEDEGKGWRIARIFPGSGAASAGMKPGDRIVAIDSVPIQGMSDYREATANKNPGDIVAVDVRRGDTIMTLQVELSARP